MNQEQAEQLAIKIIRAGYIQITILKSNRRDGENRKYRVAYTDPRTGYKTSVGSHQEWQNRQTS